MIDLRTFEPARTIRCRNRARPESPRTARRTKCTSSIRGSNNVSVIDAERNQVVATIGVHGTPYFIDVSADGKRGYVANSGFRECFGARSRETPVLGNLRVGASPGLARVSPDGKTVVVSNRGDDTVSIIDAQQLKVRATIASLPAAGRHRHSAGLEQSLRGLHGSGQVASIDLKSDKLLALLDVGHTPVNLALKPDGGELIVMQLRFRTIFRSSRPATNEVGGTYLIGEKPSRGVVTADNSRLYVSNFGSNTVAVYDIDLGKMIATMPVGSHPDGLALSQSQNYLLVLDSQSGDVTVIQKRKSTKLEPSEYSLLTMIPVGVQPNNIVVKSFMLTKEPAK